MDNTIMVDCTSEFVHIVKASRFANQPAQTYVTGGYPVEWSDAQILSFPRHIRTAQQPSPLIDDGSNARELDIETGAATAQDWVDFYHTRTDKAKATVYCSLDTVPSVISQCNFAGIPLSFRWRLAWWLHNIPGQPLPYHQDVAPPTREEVLAELQRLTGVVLEPSTLWGCQYANYAFWDLSKVYGVLDYARN